MEPPCQRRAGGVEDPGKPECQHDAAYLRRAHRSGCSAGGQRTLGDARHPGQTEWWRRAAGGAHQRRLDPSGKKLVPSTEWRVPRNFKIKTETKKPPERE